MASPPRTVPWPSQDELCPWCNLYVLPKPKECNGWHKSDHAGKWYQQCPANTYTPTSACDGFRWVIPLPSTLSSTTTGSSTQGALCSGELCRVRRKAKVRNAKCDNQLCKDDCVELARLSALGRSTFVSCHAAGHPSAPSTLSAHGGSLAINAPPPCTYARPLSALYEGKLLAMEVEARQHHKREETRLNDRRIKKHVIRVNWWNQDDLPAIKFRVEAPDYPSFHPGRSPDIVSRVSKDSCTMFEFFDFEDGSWVSTSLPVDIPRTGQLYLCTCGILDCVGFLGVMEPQGLSLKRRNTDFSDDATLPRVRIKIEGSAGQAPGAKEDPILIDIQPGTQVLPATDSLDLCSDYRDGATQDVAPRGPSGKGWPLMFAVDMAHGFDLMEQLFRRRKDRPTAFGGAFPHVPYVQSTYGDNSRLWRLLPAGVKTAAIPLGDQMRAGGRCW